MTTYFVNTGESFEFFPTKQEAIDCANSSIEFWRQLGRDSDPAEWPDEVSSVCWGEVKATAAEVPSPFQTCFDYELKEEKQECFCLVSDDDGHWYVIPVEQRDAFNTWVECAPYWDGYDGPWFDDLMLNRHISHVHFTDYKVV